VKGFSYSLSPGHPHLKQPVLDSNAPSITKQSTAAGSFNVSSASCLPSNFPMEILAKATFEEDAGSKWSSMFLFVSASNQISGPARVRGAHL